MASFILPSSIQKRLLRYALSRLELLDTDELDLEHLDINWGTKSTLEFRNVGLKLKVSPAQMPYFLSFHLLRVCLCYWDVYYVKEKPKANLSGI